MKNASLTPKELRDLHELTFDPISPNTPTDRARVLQLEAELRNARTCSNDWAQKYFKLHDSLNPKREASPGRGQLWAAALFALVGVLWAISEVWR